MISQIIFTVILTGSILWFLSSLKKIRDNIFLGKKVTVKGEVKERLKIMARVALGQGKMFTRPVAGLLHLIVYLGFLIVNIEMLEIVIDGVAGTHRVLSFMGGFYDFLIASFEFFAVAVIIACIVFLIRRNILKIKRFHNPEMTKWPKTDANLILIFEILLMTAFLTMNAADSLLQQLNAEHYVKAGAFPFSSFLHPLFSGFDTQQLIIVERSAWWFHIIGVLLFLNYLPISKHFHIIMAFPNTYFSKLEPKTALDNLEAVTREVKLMLDPNANPYEAPASNEQPGRFGAKDVTDLNRIQLLNAYTCTECGRCTSVCPANITGKKLSPRKIMMDVRDRMEELGKHKRQHGNVDDGKALIRDYISEEEIFACTTCNACSEICPVNIDPVSIIIDLRRYLVMEESKLPQEWTTMLTNIENNGAPWQFSMNDRLNWVNE